MKHFYQKELDKDCFQYDMIYGDFKDLPKRTAPFKVLHDRAFNIIYLLFNLLFNFYLSFNLQI